MPELQPLGRIPPPDTRHIDLYPLRTALREAPTKVERVLRVPWQWIPAYDQGSEGACVGFSSSWMMSLVNSRLYDAPWLYRQAQTVDGLRLPHSGTTVRAAMDILRDVGHRPIVSGRSRPPSLAEGIEENRWAQTVDELRACIAAGIPVVVGADWYSAWDEPFEVDDEPWCSERDRGRWGRVRGGHAFCLAGASDRRGAFVLLNSWGRAWGRLGVYRAWWPYECADDALRQSGGEATVITDREQMAALGMVGVLA